MKRFPLWPLAWSSGIAAGVTVAAVLGPYAPSWGAALAFVTLAVLFSAGSFIEGSLGPSEGEGMTQLLRLAVGLTAGFLLVSVPLTVTRLADIVDAAPPEGVSEAVREVAALRTQLAVRWAVIGAAFACGVLALLLRGRRSRRRAAQDGGAAQDGPQPPAPPAL